jgi:hypothetical protein
MAWYRDSFFMSVLCFSCNVIVCVLHGGYECGVISVLIFWILRFRYSLHVKQWLRSERIYVSSFIKWQNTWIWSDKIVLGNQVLLCDIKIVVWCALIVNVSDWPSAVPQSHELGLKLWTFMNSCLVMDSRTFLLCMLQVILFVHCNRWWGGWQSY